MLFLFVGIVIGFIIGFFCVKILTNNLYENIKIENANLKGKLETIQKENENNINFVKNQYENTITNSKNREIDDKKQIEQLHNEKNKLIADLTKYETLKNEGENREKESKKEFENIANSVIKENKKDIDALLKPYKDQIENLQKDLSSNKDLLNNKVNEIHESTKNFVDAIKINKKVQGNMGEMQLEMLLEKFGLQEGVNYERQVNTKNEEGERKIPDIVVKLPDNNVVIIDSKVSLNNYMEYNKAESKEQERVFMEEYVKDLKKHIKELSNQEYTKLFKNYNVVGYTLMFLPFEKAFIESISYDSSIFDTAYQNKIVIVTPSSLMGILGTIEQINKIEKQNKNIKEVFKNVESLCEKVVRFEKEVSNVVENIDKAKASWVKAQETYINGKGGIISLKEKLEKLESKEGKLENKRRSEEELGFESEKE